MIFTLLLGVFTGAIAVVFAMDNATLVTVNFLAWSWTAPLAMIVISAATFGIAVVLVAKVAQDVRSALDADAIRRAQERAEQSAILRSEQSSNAQ